MPVFAASNFKVNNHYVQNAYCRTLCPSLKYLMGVCLLGTHEQYFGILEQVWLTYIL